MQERKSNLILSLIQKQWDRNIFVKRVKSLKIGDKVKANNGFAGTILAFGIVCNQYFVWIEIPVGNGKAIHHGVKITDIN